MKTALAFEADSATRIRKNGDIVPPAFRFLTKIEFDLLSAEQKWVYLRQAYDELERGFEELARSADRIASLGDPDGAPESVASFVRIPDGDGSKR